MADEWVGEVYSTLALTGERAFSDGTRFGIVYVQDLILRTNPYIKLISYGGGTAGFSVDMEWEDYSTRLKAGTLIPIYKKPKQ